MSKTKVEELVEALNGTSNKQLLYEFSGGKEIAQLDVEMIEEVRRKSDLSEPVLNVLLYYVMLKNDMRLDKHYIEKIAAHWNRKKIKTVEEALDILTKEQIKQKEVVQQKEVDRLKVKKLSLENKVLTKKVTELEQEISMLKEQFQQFREDLKNKNLQ